MNKRFKRIYIEITNNCNLNCSFCVGHHRESSFLTADQFRIILDKVKDYTDYIYYHVMGEPLLNDDIEQILRLTKQYGLKSCLTTNGTLLAKRAECLVRYADNIHQLSISLQAQQGNDLDLDNYLNQVCAFVKKIQGKTNICLRLWNIGGVEKDNDLIIKALQKHFPNPWRKNEMGYCLDEKLYLEFAKKFDWPDLTSDKTMAQRYYCYGLNSQIAILVDGTVTACCLDHDGDINLGNIFKQNLQDIITSKRALAIIQGFQDGKAHEMLCQKCQYASRFINEK